VIVQPPRSKSGKVGKAVAKLNTQQAAAQQPQVNVQLDSFPMSFDYFEETWGVNAESMSMSDVKTVG
jgi:hypothetical protein